MVEKFAKVGIIVPPDAVGEVSLTCPRCQHERKKHPNARSLRVNVSTGLFKCWHCGWADSVDGKRDSYLSSVNRHATESRHSYTRPKYKRGELPDHAVEWLRSRKISSAVIERNKIGFAKHFFAQSGRNENAVAFPTFVRGEVVNVKYRALGEKMFAQEKDAEPAPYKFDDVDGKRVFAITEGEIDALSLEEAGIAEACSVPGGGVQELERKSDARMRFLDLLAPTIDAAERVVIASDNDGPGRRLLEELARRIGKEKTWVMKYPEGCKDANEVLMKWGALKLKECYELAEPYPIDGLLWISDVASNIVDVYENGLTGGVSTGWRSVDYYYTVKLGQLTVVGGVPGHGKTTWLDALMVNLAESQGWVFSVFSPENFPPARFFIDILEKRVRKPFWPGPTERMTIDELDDAMVWVRDHFVVMNPAEDECTVDSFMELAAASVFRHGARGIVGDPWNELEHDYPDNVSETQYVSKTLSRFRRFARRRDTHMWWVSHPTKLQRLKGKDTFPRPTLYDLSGSAAWKNKPDCGVIIWRDVRSNVDRTKIVIEKVRFKEVGRSGEVDLGFDRVTGCYCDLPGSAIPAVQAAGTTVPGAVSDDDDEMVGREIAKPFSVGGKPSETPF